MINTIKNIKEFYSWVYEEDTSEEISSALVLSFPILMILEYILFNYILNEDTRLFDMSFLDFFPIGFGAGVVMMLPFVIIFHILLYKRYR